MNTASSVWYGWAFFITVGAGSFYFAKRAVNQDRAQRQAFENERRMQRNRQIAMAEQQADKRAAELGLRASGVPKKGEGGATRGSGTSQGAPGTAAEHAREKSRFEASEPYRSPKGDRFS